MRAVGLADIELAVRVLLAVPEAQRPALMAELLSRADTADRYRKRLGRMHPAFGSGTLASAAGFLTAAPRPARIDGVVLATYRMVLEALIHRSA